MASKKKKKKAPKRTPEFQSGERPLRFADMTKKEQQSAIGLVNQASLGAPDAFQKKVEEGERPGAPHSAQLKGRRAKEALPDVVSQPYVHEDAIARHIGYMRDAATSVRLPGEGIGGEGFYFGNVRQVNDAVQDTDVPFVKALDAASKLSVRTTPEREKDSLTALVHAHQTGVVHFTPDLVGALHSLEDKQGNQVYSVPDHLVGRSVPFAEVPHQVASLLTHPEIRDAATRNTDSVNIEQLARVPMRRNIASAHQVLQGASEVSPYKNPKQSSYSLAHEVSVPDSDEEMEYRLRASHLGDVLRGDIHPGQMMLDYYGLRDSDEGVLSSTASTPADIHQKRIAYNQPGKAFAAAPDILKVGAKQATTRRGKELSVGMGEKNVTPIGIEHAVHQDVVHEAAKRLKESYGLEYTVPAILAQETAWAGERRGVGDDPAFNAWKREQDSIEKAKNRGVAGAQFTQGTLF